MTRKVVRWAMLTCFGLAAVAGAGDGPGVDAPTALARLKELAGDWTGNAGGSPGSVSFHVTGGGTAVAETLFSGTPHEMLTVYHLDGDDLVLTHYCVSDNQPRMKLDRRASTPDDLRFVFAGGSNVKESEPHMHEARIRFTGKDRYEAEWTAFKNGTVDHVGSFKEMTRKK